MVKAALLLASLLSISNPQFDSGGVSGTPASSYYEAVGAVRLASKSFSLDERYSNKWVNDVFKDNILLALNYLDGQTYGNKEIKWENIEKPNTFGFSLKPGQSFAFHDEVLPTVKNVVKTTNSHFDFTEGYRSDGKLMGDGVCHIASLLYWAAKEAGLKTLAPTNHDFAKINGVPKEYGVSIYSLPGDPALSARQNLYITNNFEKDVTFNFIYDGKNITVDVIKDQ